MKEIQAWLGHSDYGTTANLYAHLDMEESMLISAERLSTGLFGTLPGPANPDSGKPNQNTGEKDAVTEDNVTPLHFITV
jgi:hypothetical protein